MPQPSLKIDHARYIISVDEQRRIIRDGSVLVENGRISRVGRADELAATGADRVIDARHFVVTPGFVNGHMHISYAHPVRGIFPDDLGSPLKQVFALQTAMTEEEEYHTTLLALLELVRNGTVCLLDPGSTKFPDACLQAYEDAGVRVIMGEAVTDREAPFTLPRYATAERSRAPPPSSTGGTGAWRDGSAPGPCRSRRRPAAPSCCRASSVSSTSEAPASRSTTAAGRRRERTIRAAARKILPNIWRRWACSVPTCCSPTRWVSTTRRWTALLGAERPSRCARSRPRRAPGVPRP